MASPELEHFIPPLPYRGGWRFSVQEHVPPPPTGALSDSNHDKAEVRSNSPEPQLQDNLDLRAIAPLRVGVNFLSQVLLVEAESSLGPVERGMQLVAKVYDPLYASDEGGLTNQHRANECYTREVHIYRLLAHFQGGLIPKFYGAFSFSIPVGDSGTRQVRLILIEYVPGPTMAESMPQMYSQWQRQDMLKSILDFEAVLVQHDLVVLDLTPRNVIVTEVRDGSNVVFIDFGDIYPSEEECSEQTRKRLFLGQYLSPLLRRGRSPMVDFFDWVDWDWRTWVRNKYADDAEKITKEMKEFFVSYMA